MLLLLQSATSSRFIKIIQDALARAVAPIDMASLRDELRTMF